MNSISDTHVCTSQNDTLGADGAVVSVGGDWVLSCFLVVGVQYKAL